MNITKVKNGHPWIIILKSGLTRWVDQGPDIRIGLSWRKNRGRKNPVWPGDPVDPARSSQKHNYDSLIFFFLLKQYHFNLKKKTLNNLIKIQDDFELHWPPSQAKPKTMAWMKTLAYLTDLLRLFMTMK